MTKRRTPTLKDTLIGHFTDFWCVVPVWFVHGFLGLGLITAGMIELYQLTLVSEDQSVASLVIMLFCEVELFGGIYLAVGFDPPRGLQWAAAGFGGLTVSFLFQIIAGKCSCGCFGSLTINPWFGLIFSLAAVAALLGTRRAADLKGEFPDRCSNKLGLGVFALAIGIAGWLQADLVTLAGSATWDGRPLQDATLAFAGNSGRIEIKANNDGTFRLPLVRPGLYSVSIPYQPIPAPIAERERPDRDRAGTKGKQRARRKSVPPSQAIPRKSLLWIEISKCNEYDRTIRF